MCSQVLAPLMGSVRNYHCYEFTDWKDGAVWGPEDGSEGHVWGYDFLDDRKTQLAEILQVFAVNWQTSMLCMFYADYSGCRLDMPPRVCTLYQSRAWCMCTGECLHRFYPKNSANCCLHDHSKKPVTMTAHSLLLHV